MLWCFNNRGVETGLATARPKFPEPTIKNFILLSIIKHIRNFYITVVYSYHFNKGIVSKEHDTNILQAKLHYNLGACKNNSRSLRVKL